MHVTTAGAGIKHCGSWQSIAASWLSAHPVEDAMDGRNLAVCVSDGPRVAGVDADGLYRCAAVGICVRGAGSSRATRRGRVRGGRVDCRGRVRPRSGSSRHAEDAPANCIRHLHGREAEEAASAAGLTRPGLPSPAQAPAAGRRGAGTCCKAGRTGSCSAPCRAGRRAVRRTSKPWPCPSSLQKTQRICCLEGERARRRGRARGR